MTLVELKSLFRERRSEHDVLSALRKLEEGWAVRLQYRGSSFPKPTKGPATGWPWKSGEAEAVYRRACCYLQAHADAEITDAFQAGLSAEGLALFDLAPEDRALMDLALSWLKGLQKPS